ncbi:MAG: VanZ family protein [Chloroflexia bacterium]|nr:VanZ family protein [Chloroflexia bacterium]
MKKSYFSVIFLGYLIFLTIYSIIPSASMSEKYGIAGFELRLDYWLHLGAYFGVAFLFLLWQFNTLVDQRILVIGLSWLGCELFAYTTELIQLLVPGRTYNIYDFVANTSGIAIAYLFFLVFKKRLKQSKLRLISI